MELIGALILIHISCSVLVEYIIDSKRLKYNKILSYLFGFIFGLFAIFIVLAIPPAENK